MMKAILTTLMSVLSISVGAASCSAEAMADMKVPETSFDKPFGWATCTSLTSGGDFDLTGGGNGNRIVLKSNGGDMSGTIRQALLDYDIVVLDGSNGDFMLSEAISLQGVHNKTLFGVNKAVMKSIFYITKEMMADFDAIDVEHSGAQRLNPKPLDVNGKPCNTMRSVNYHNIITKHTGDTEEKWLKSGCLWLSGCTNWIIRNITMTGPGSISSSHAGDTMTLMKGCKHIWVDHCVILDGADGNFDITSECDFITVSYCRFEYTERSYAHRLCSLIGGNVNDKDPGKLNVTFARCIWASNDKWGVSRQPMVRYGHVHVVNCYYPCKRSGTLMHARDGSNMLVEGNFFEDVKKFFSDSLASNFIVRDNLYNGDPAPRIMGNVELPYKMTILPASQVPSVVFSQNGAGATLELKATDLL